MPGEVRVIILSAVKCGGAVQCSISAVQCVGRDEEAAATQTGEAGRGGVGVSGAAAVNGHYEQLRGDLVTTLDLQMQT